MMHVGTSLCLDGFKCRYFAERGLRFAAVLVGCRYLVV